MKFESNTRAYALLKNGDVRGAVVTISKRCTSGWAVQVELDLWDVGFRQRAEIKGLGFDLEATALAEILSSNREFFGEYPELAYLNNAEEILLRKGYAKRRVC